MCIRDSYTYRGAGIGNATILFEVSGPDGLHYVGAVPTDEGGYASFSFLIPSGSPFGEYTINATAYREGYENASASLILSTAYLEPRLVLSLEGPEEALTREAAQFRLHVVNSGNTTAHGVEVEFLIPEGLTVLSGETSYDGSIEAGEEVVLTVLLTTGTPGPYTLHAAVSYERPDGTPMPSLSTELETLWVYHPDYPIDITGMAVSQEGDGLLVTLNVTNYGGGLPRPGGTLHRPAEVRGISPHLQGGRHNPGRIGSSS